MFGFKYKRNNCWGWCQYYHYFRRRRCETGFKIRFLRWFWSLLSFYLNLWLLLLFLISLLWWCWCRGSLNLRFWLLFRNCGDERLDAIDIDIDFPFVQLNSDIAVIPDFCDYIRSCPFWRQFLVLLRKLRSSNQICWPNL